MSLTTRSLRLHLLSVLGTPLGGAKVTLQLSAYQVDGTDIVPLVWPLSEDPGATGDYIGSIWPNTRGDAGTHYDMLVQANGQQLLAQVVTVTGEATEVVLRSKINPPPYPAVYAADKAVSTANSFSDSAGASASLALAAAAGLGDVSGAVEAAQAAAAQAAAAEVQRLEYEDRVYPGVYSSPPTAKPHSGLPCAQGDRCSILVGVVAYEHLFMGGGWLIPNIDATSLQLTGAAVQIGSGVANVETIADLLAQSRRAGVIYRVRSYYGGWAARAPYRGPSGGGDFMWVPDSTRAADGGYVFFVPGVAVGRFERVCTGTVTMEQFGRVADSLTDDSIPVNAAVGYAWRMGGGVVHLGPGWSPIDKLTQRRGVFIQGPGSRSGGFLARPRTDPGSPYGHFEIDNGPVASAHMKGVGFFGSATPVYGDPAVNSMQWGAYIHAKWDSLYTHGGLWNSNFEDVVFWNYNFGWWSRGGYTDAHSLRPNQFLEFNNVQIAVQTGGIPWMWTGQHGQVNITNGNGEGLSPAGEHIASIAFLLTWDPNPAGTADNFSGHGESTMDTAGQGLAVRVPTQVNCRAGFAMQKAKRGWQAIGPVRNCAVDGPWFEQTGVAISADSGAQVVPQNVRFANAGRSVLLDSSAAFTAAIVGTVMTVSGVSSGKLEVGQLVLNAGLSMGTIKSGPAAGGVGDYVLSGAQMVASTAFTARGCGGLVRQGSTSLVIWGKGNAAFGSFDSVVTPDSASVNDVDAWNFDNEALNVQSTDGAALLIAPRGAKVCQIDATGRIDVKGIPQVTVTDNADRSVGLSTVNGRQLPGQRVLCLASGGSRSIRGNGNVHLGVANLGAVTVPSGGYFVLERLLPRAGTVYEWALVSWSPHHASAVPADGFYYSLGHKVWNTNPAPGAVPGWVCVTAGIAGSGAVFRAMGTLATSA